jgi:hypothetical protein
LDQWGLYCLDYLLGLMRLLGQHYLECLEHLGVLLGQQLLALLLGLMRPLAQLNLLIQLLPLALKNL